MRKINNEMPTAKWGVGVFAFTLIMGVITKLNDASVYKMPT